MGIGDYFWPFERKFSQIPCAREASIAALFGGPSTGAVILILGGKPGLVYKTTIYSGLGVFWVSFLICRYQFSRSKQLSEQFREAQRSGKLD